MIDRAPSPQINHKFSLPKWVWITVWAIVVPLAVAVTLTALAIVMAALNVQARLP